MAPENAERFAAVLDEPRGFRPGDELPLLWHWAYFAEIVGQSELGADGHPGRGDALAERFPRRMAASGSVDRIGPYAWAGPPRDTRTWKKPRRSTGVRGHYSLRFGVIRSSRTAGPY